jgi:TolB protein
MGIIRFLLSITFGLLLLCIGLVSVVVFFSHGLPKNDELVFMYRRDSNHDWKIYIMDIERRLMASLLNTPFLEYSPAWSPDGNQIAFEGSTDIYIFDLVSSETRRLTNSLNVAEWDIAWSPDSTQVVFVSYDAESNSQLFIINSTGSNLQQLTVQGGWSPSWSSDNNQIAFSCFVDSTIQICTMNISDNNTVQNLVALRADSGEPAWSPEGSQILSTCFTARASLLCMIDPRSGHSRFLTDSRFASVRNPAWSSDEMRIVFIDNGDIYVINADGSNAQRLTYGDGEYASPAWRP